MPGKPSLGKPTPGKPVPGQRLAQGMTPHLALLAALELLLLAVVGGAIFSGRAATGGDLASHYQTLLHLLESLPEGRLLDWMPEALAGFPLFQPYFPLPFLLMAAAAPVLGPETAFNLGSLVGVFALPPAAWCCLRWLGQSRIVALCGAVGAVAFLLHESHVVWGGNLLSVLAGEFAYSHGVVWFLLFLGLLGRCLRERESVVWPASALAGLALSHGYPFVVAMAVAPAFLLVVPRGAVRAAGTVVLGLGLTAFWLVPSLAYAPYGTAYGDEWGSTGWGSVLPPSLVPWMLLAVGWGVVALCGWGRIRKQDGWLLPLLVTPLVSFVLFRAAWFLGLVDIRFPPFGQLALVLLGACALGRIAEASRAPLLLTWIAFLAVAVGQVMAPSRIPGWADWNYRGFEGAPGWAEFSRVMEEVRGDLGDSRVAWEHSPLYDTVGTIRAFESVPRFSGRATLEGLYGQSSLSSPFLFLLQSQISSLQSCPFPNFGCSWLDPDGAAPRLRTFAAGEVIVRSDRAIDAYESSSSYELVSRVPPYSVYRLKGEPPRYVEPLEQRPLVIDAPLADWKGASYRWFRRDGWTSRPLVWSGTPGASELGRKVRELPDFWDGVPFPSPPRASARLGRRSIRLETETPGHPLLVKVSYHPRWRASDGSAVHLAAPSLMLVVPRSRQLELRFERTGVEIAGLSISVVSVLVVGLILRRRRGGGREGHSRWVAASVESVLRGCLLGSYGLAMILACAPWEVPTEDRRLDEAMSLYREEGCAPAWPKFASIVEDFPASRHALEGVIHLARCDASDGNWRSAREWSRRFAIDYPRHPYVAEAWFRWGESLYRLGDVEAASATFRELRDRHPESDWLDDIDLLLARPSPAASPR